MNYYAKDSGCLESKSANDADFVNVLEMKLYLLVNDGMKRSQSGVAMEATGHGCFKYTVESFNLSVFLRVVGRFLKYSKCLVYDRRRKINLQ